MNVGDAKIAQIWSAQKKDTFSHSARSIQNQRQNPNRGIFPENYE
jgi:hypothetical protein